MLFKLAAHVGVSEISSAGQSKADALRTRAVGYKGLSVIVKSVAPRIAKPFHKDSQIHGRRTQMPYPSAVQPLDTVGRFDVAVNVNGLVKIKLPVRPPAQRVHDVMRVFGSEAGEDDALLACFASARPLK